MQYLLLLTNIKTKEENEITVSADLPLEELSAHIKVALNLPYTDNAWHHFQAFGITYMSRDIWYIDEEIRGECELPTLEYQNSEDITLSQIFTTLESSIMYHQEDSYTIHKVRCTLLERIDNDIPDFEEYDESPFTKW